MIEKLVLYLRHKGEAVSSLELAEKVLYMHRPSPATADRLLESLVRDCSDILRTRDGRWTAAPYSGPSETPLSATFFSLCSLLPERAPDWMSWRALGMVHMRPGDPVDQIRTWTFDRDRSRRLRAALTGVLRIAGDGPILFDGFGNQISLFHRAAREAAGVEVENPVWSLKRLVRRLHPGISISDRSQLATRLDLPALESDSIEVLTAHLGELFCAWSAHPEVAALESLSELEGWLTDESEAIEYSRYAFDRAFWASCPDAPGVYLMRDQSGEVLYVGKARNLARRLRSYFIGTGSWDDKVRHLHDRLYDIELRVTGSELEALLLENELIGRFQPAVNRQMKVHARSGRRACRYSRILVLPSADPDRAVLYLFGPHQPLVTLEVDRRRTPCEFIEQQILATFYTPPAITQEDTRSEIVASWLAQHDDEVRSIDMRKIGPPGEAVRLIADHLATLERGAERVVHY